MLDYSDYNSIIDVLEKADLDNTYKELISKENKVLDTVNNLVRHKEKLSSERKQFIHMSLYEIYNLLFLELPKMGKELEKTKNLEEMMQVFFKGHRVIYIGIIMVLISIFLFFVEHSSK